MTQFKIIFGRFLCILFVVFSTFFSFNAEAGADLANQNDKLMERISKDYTNKFCNSIAFGLSQESAMNFANKENNQIYRNKKGFENINKELLANKIANSVIDSCGYVINLMSEKDVEVFQKNYILMNDSFSQSN